MFIRTTAVPGVSKTVRSLAVRIDFNETIRCRRIDRAVSSPLAPPIKTGTEHNQTQCHRAAAQQRRYRVGRTIRCLNLQISDVRDVFGLLGREDRDREPYQPKKNQHRAKHRQSVH